jgi:ectoine hydroxylase-related dioxygenase (phytanoyl-CoA dioxygenase family)
MDREMFGCQTINFFTGSRRALHQDHVHMTTKPYGHLAASWVALEDIHPNSGPLMYAPGSQWLPYIDSKTIYAATPPGGHPNDAHQRIIEDRLQQARLPVHTFTAKKGDVLLWHCNLVHGGAPVVDPSLSRLSMACHYAAVGVEYYHEWSGLQRDPATDLLEHEGRKYLPEYYDEDGTAIPTLKALRERQAARQTTGRREEAAAMPHSM